MFDMPILSLKMPGDRIAFFGPMVSGKTFCADALAKNDYYTKVAFAAPLKKIAADLYNVTGKNGDDRTLLQALGEDLRKHDPEVWIKYLLRSVQTIEENRLEPWRHRIVLDDLRYINEAEALKRNGFMICLVSVPESERKGRLVRLYPETPVSSYYHASETEWQGIPYDAVIDSSVNAVPVIQQIRAARAFYTLSYTGS